MEYIHSIIYLLVMVWTIAVLFKLEFIVSDMRKNIEEGNGTLSMVEAFRGLTRMRWKLFIIVAFCALGVFL